MFLRVQTDVDVFFAQCELSLMASASESESGLSDLIHRYFDCLITNYQNFKTQRMALNVRFLS